jgi:hypothetical protein
MSNMTIKVDLMPGTLLSQAINEAKQMASKLDVAYIEFNFNGTKFLISRTADMDKTFNNWQNAKNKPKFVAA